MTSSVGSGVLGSALVAGLVTAGPALTVGLFAGTVLTSVSFLILMVMVLTFVDGPGFIPMETALQCVLRSCHYLGGRVDCVLWEEGGQGEGAGGSGESHTPSTSCSKTIKSDNYTPDQIR